MMVVERKKETKDKRAFLVQHGPGHPVTKQSSCLFLCHITTASFLLLFV